MAPGTSGIRYQERREQRDCNDIMTSYAMLQQTDRYHTYTFAILYLFLCSAGGIVVSFTLYLLALTSEYVHDRHQKLLSDSLFVICVEMYKRGREV